MRRARQPHQKLERREAILAAARAALAGSPYHAITMVRIAKETGLVKGTLYLYFATKEELFLEVFRDELHAWLWELEARLPELPRRGRREALARLLADTLASRPTFRRLLAVLHDQLEANLPEDTARDFRREFLALTSPMAIQLERAWPSLGPGQGRRLLSRTLALAIGLQVMVEPAPAAARALEQPGMAPLKLSFGDEIQSALSSLLGGWRPFQTQA